MLHDRGETERADQLDARATELRTKLDKAPAVAAVNPQATILGLAVPPARCRRHDGSTGGYGGSGGTADRTVADRL